MGCWTIYIVRELDGSLWWSGEKWGALAFDSPDQRLANLANRAPARPGFLTAPATYDALRARWPGWQVLREPEGLAGCERRVRAQPPAIRTIVVRQTS